MRAPESTGARFSSYMVVSTPSLTLSTQRTTLMASRSIWTIAPEEGADLSASRE